MSNVDGGGLSIFNLKFYLNLDKNDENLVIKDEPTFDPFIFMRSIYIIINDFKTVF